jgi:hypothetical protein
MKWIVLCASKICWEIKLRTRHRTSLTVGDRGGGCYEEIWRKSKDPNFAEIKVSQDLKACEKNSCHDLSGNT